MAPVVILAVLAGAVLLGRRRRQGDVDTENESAPEPETAMQDGSWNTAWGTPNEYDRRYPQAVVERPVPVSWDDFDPVFRTKLTAAFRAMEARGFDPVVFEAGRSQRRQAYLYGKGRPSFPGYGSTKGPIVTQILTAGKHGQYPAKAADVISRKSGWSDKAFYAAWGEEAKKAGLTWGGDWKTLVDMPHVEVP